MGRYTNPAFFSFLFFQFRILYCNLIRSVLECTLNILLIDLLIDWLIDSDEEYSEGVNVPWNLGQRSERQKTSLSSNCPLQKLPNIIIRCKTQMTKISSEFILLRHILINLVQLSSIYQFLIGLRCPSPESEWNCIVYQRVSWIKTKLTSFWLRKTVPDLAEVIFSTKRKISRLHFLRMRSKIWQKFTKTSSHRPSFYPFIRIWDIEHHKVIFLTMQQNS